MADGVATGVVGTEGLEEPGPQGEGGGPEGVGQVSKGDLGLGEALLDLSGVQDVRQR